MAAVHTGVVGSTGVESAELIQALAREIKPAVVIAVDALPPVLLLGWGRPSRSPTPVSSLVPGVGNARAALNQETLGIPVIAMGVPTDVDAGTLVAELTGRNGRDRRSWNG